MVFFNDPEPVADHQFAAVRTAVEMRERFAAAIDGLAQARLMSWDSVSASRRGSRRLGVSASRAETTNAAIGNSVILASRLSGAAAAGQILVSQRVLAAIEDRAELDPVPNLELKGFSHAMTAYAVNALVKSAAG